MKKHFLLLMMAFFSLAGWAQTVTPDNVVINFSPAKYGGGAPNMEVSYEGNIRTVDNLLADEHPEHPDFTWDGKYYTDQACTTEAEALAVSTNNYYIKIVGVATTIFNGVEKVGYFKVEPADLTITAIEGLTKDYDGQPLNTTIASIEDITFEGFVGLDDEDDLTVASTISFVYGNYSDAGEYPVTAVNGISSPNYTLKYADDLKAIISPLVIPAEATITIVGATEADPKNVFTYNATRQGPDYTVTWGEGDDAVTLTSADFRVEFYDAEENLITDDAEEPAPAKPINAAGAVDADGALDEAGYTAVLFGVGNYTTLDENEDEEQDGIVIEDGGFVIKKAPLNVTAIAQNKVYDGEEFDLGTAQISINGLVAGETVTGCVAVYTDELEDHSDAATYAVTVNTDEATIGESRLSANYNVVAIPSNWTISKRPVNLTLSNVTKPLGTAVDEVLDGEAVAEDNVEAAIYEEEELINKRGALAEDVDAIVAAYDLALDETVMEGVEELELGTYTNAVTATIEEAVTNYEITVVPANLVVTGQDFVVYPVVPANIQYGDPYTIGYNAYVAGEGGAYVSGATIDKDQLVFVINGTEYAYNEEGIEGLPTELGNYVVTIKEGTAVGTGDNASGEATTMAGNFAIGKKILNVTVGDLTVHAGDPITIIEKAGVTFAGEKQDYDEVLEALEYSLTEATAGNVTVDEDGIITAVDEGGAKITVSLPEDFESDYYELAEVTEENEGTLTLSDEYLLVLGGEDTKEDIETAETNGSENVVAIFEEGAVTMKEREWYAMVLPFATSAEELVNVLGTYVVVNTLSDKSTDQNFKFTLEMGEIPAGTPFIIKPNEAIDWGAAVPVYYQEGDEIPDGSEVGDLKEYASVAFAGKTIDSEIYPYGAEGIVNIDGTYESGDILGVAGKESASTATIIDRVWWLSDTDYEASVIANDWRKPKKNAHELKPMEAYLIAADGWTTYAPVITVEDFDGQTTAIKTLNADKINGLNTSDGWYNLNGMKMQGAPTQKGVYINNGKKVILK